MLTVPFPNGIYLPVLAYDGSARHSSRMLVAWLRIVVKEQVLKNVIKQRDI